MLQKALTHEETKLLAKEIVKELFSMMTEDENIAVAAKAWGIYLDKWIGKNFRKLFVWILGILVTAVLAVKFEVLVRFLAK